MTRIFRALAALLFLSITAQAQVPGQLAPGTMWGNPTASRAAGSPATLSAIIDRAISSIQGSMLYRNSTIWTALNPGTAGLPLLSGGAGANLAYGILGLSAGGFGGSQATATVGQIPQFDGTKYIPTMPPGVSVVAYGADPTGTLDSTTAINACLSLNNHCIVPSIGPGVTASYKTSSCINIGSEQSLTGDSTWSASRLVSNSTTANVICIAANAADWQIANLWIDRSATPIGSGCPECANGIWTSGHSENGLLQNLYVTNQWDGFHLGVTGNGYVYQSITANNYNVGLFLRQINFTPVTGTAAGAGGAVVLAVSSTALFSTGTSLHVASVGGTTEADGDWLATVIDATHVLLQGTAWAHAWTSGGTAGLGFGGLQWQLHDVLSETNNEYGFLVDCSVVAQNNTQCTLGNWDNIRTFANQLGGVAFQGATGGLGIFDLVGSNFFTGDSGPGVYFDTFGSFNRIVNGTMEEAGTITGGRGALTAAPNVGFGITITENNQYTQLVGVNVNTSANECIYNGGSNTVISGGMFWSCGLAGSGLIGVHQLATGSSTITGNSFSTLAYGIYYESDNANNIATGNQGTTIATSFIYPTTLSLASVYANAPASSQNVIGSIFTSKVMTGTAPLTVASTTRVANLNVASSGNADTVTTAPPITSFTGTANYNLTTATGTQAVTGLGFRPSSCIFSGSIGGLTTTFTTLLGFSDSAKHGLSLAYDSNSIYPSAARVLAAVDSTGSNKQIATISTYDTDGFTLSWTKTGTPSGTFVFNYLCYK